MVDQKAHMVKDRDGPTEVFPHNLDKVKALLIMNGPITNVDGLQETIERTVEEKEAHHHNGRGLKTIMVLREVDILKGILHYIKIVSAILLHLALTCIDNGHHPQILSNQHPP